MSEHPWADNYGRVKYDNLFEQITDGNMFSRSMMNFQYLMKTYPSRRLLDQVSQPLSHIPIAPLNSESVSSCRRLFGGD